MTFQAVPEGVEVKLLMTQNQVHMANVFNVRTSGAVVPSDLIAIAAVFNAWITSDYAGIISSSLHFDEIICTDKSVPNGGQVIVIPTTTNGAIGTTQMAGNAALVASFRTALTGRNYRGRAYVPALVVSAFTDAQHVTVPFAANVNTAFTNLITALTAATYTLSVLSRFLNNAQRALGTLTAIVTVITNTIVDSQQRRTAN